MATGKRDQCGALCQHPGCWKSTEILYNTPRGYMAKLERNKNFNSGESLESSYTEDGLPTLKINTLECGTVTTKSTLPYVNIKTPRKSRKRFYVQRPKINYNQLVLEEEDNNVEVDPWITYTPVLLWKSGTQRDCGITPQSKQQSECESTKTIGVDELKKVGMRSQVNVAKTDLTEALPPPKDSIRLKEHVSILQKMGLASTASLSCLNDVDLPEPVLKEILNQLRSESSMSLIGSPRITQSGVHQTARVHQNLPPGQTPHVSTRMQRSICNLSPSKVTKEARRQSPQCIESFSRQLSIKPVETLQRFHATTKNNKITSRSDRDVFLQFSDTTHAPSKQENLLDLLPYSRQRNNKKVPILIPKARTEAFSRHCAAHPNNSFDLGRKPGYQPAFKHNRKIGRGSPSLSDLDFSEESSIADDGIMDLPKFVSGPRAPANSCCDSSIPSLPQSRATQSLMTPLSPDYMRMSAKVSSGKLILTDRRKGRTTTVRKLTMSDSELNGDSEFNLEKNFLPSPVHELKDELGQETKGVMMNNDDDNDDDNDSVFEVEKKGPEK